MTLSVRIRHRQGNFRLDVEFESSGRLTALFGPSGSGKTSLINAIGGLFRPAEARISAESRVFVDTSAGIFVPKHRRRIGYVFQDGRQFPHLSVAQNLDYGRWMHGFPRDEDTRTRVIAMLGIEHLLTRRTGALSGGERQRIAIGRALLTQPRLLLLDEPLASLDATRKAEILPYLTRLRDEAGIPMVYVTHQAGEIRRIATRVVRLEDGRVTGAGGLEQIDAGEAALA